MRGLKSPIGSQVTPRLDMGGCVLYAPLWRPDMVAKGGLIVNGTGICTGSPLYLAVGDTTVDVTQAGNFTVTMPEGGTVASGTMTVTGSPVTITAGVATTVTTTGATGNITCTVSNIIRSKDTNNYALTVIGATWTSQGRSFDGTDDNINAGNGASLNGLTAITIGCWVKLDTLTHRGVVTKWDDAADAKKSFRIGLNNDNQNLYLQTWTTSAITSSSGVIAFNTWYHFVGTYDGSNQRVYLNGVLKDTDAQTGSLQTVTTNLIIGATGATPLYFWDGMIGEALLYNRAQSVGEIMHNYQATKWRYQ